jgi:hypothetical protein
MIFDKISIFIIKKLIICPILNVSINRHIFFLKDLIGDEARDGGKNFNLV